MSPVRAAVIACLFDEAEEMFPDKSTEFLFAITCDLAAHAGMKIDCADVAEAL